MTDLRPVAGSTGLRKFLDSLVGIRADAALTGGQLGVSESWAPRGHGSAVHIHSREDEAFFVVDGEIRFWFDDEPPFTRGAGELVWLPRARKHAFTVTSATARFLVLTTPAGFERLFETGTAAADAAIPPSGAMTDDELERAATALAEVGVTVVGPPHAV